MVALLVIGKFGVHAEQLIVAPPHLLELVQVAMLVPLKEALLLQESIVLDGILLAGFPY